MPVGKENWSEIGSNISDMVQQAIDAQDFSKLNETIQNTISTAVNSAANGVIEGMNSAGDSINRAADRMRGRNVSAGRMQRPKKSTAAQNPWKGNGQFEKKTADYMSAKDLPENECYSGGGATRMGGYLLTVFGSIGCFGFGLGILVVWIIAVSTDFNLTLPLLIQLPFLAASIVMLWRGTSILGKIRRFKSYVRALGTRTCATLKELAGSTGRSERAVLKDIRGMIESGMFRQGHLDVRGKNLFVTDAGYEAYLQNEQLLAARQTAQLQEKKAQNTSQTNDRLSEDVRKIITEGQAYIEKIHAGNDAIHDEEVSQKLDDLEAVCVQIFRYVERHPESAQETKKLMKYYLPTTIRLLDSYQRLNAQPVQSAKILKSKKEIEETLDTLNQAFAKLFDNLYQDTSMDITSDISVLNTLLAQEGLTGNTIN